ncbi:MAG: hypothetical protein ACI4IK_07600 [Eubacterium sp.]
MKDNEWQEFCSTGSIFDYLKYKEHEKVTADGDINKGLSNQRTDNRGE